MIAQKRFILAILGFFILLILVFNISALYKEKNRRNAAEKIGAENPAQDLNQKMANDQADDDWNQPEQPKTENDKPDAGHHQILSLQQQNSILQSKVKALTSQLEDQQEQLKKTILSQQQTIQHIMEQQQPQQP